MKYTIKPPTPPTMTIVLTLSEEEARKVQEAAEAYVQRRPHLFEEPCLFEVAAAMGAVLARFRGGRD